MTTRNTKKGGAKAPLSFGKGNAKLDKSVLTFSLPAGFTCPAADKCLSRADKVTGKIKDGKATEYRCYAASQEALYKNVRQARWSNLDILNEAKKAGDRVMAGLILVSLPKKVDVVRIHVSGDFFCEEYLDDWLMVARLRPNVKFYFYTKRADLWVKRLKELGDGRTAGSLKNVVPTYSIGGKWDALAACYKLRFVKVVESPTHAAAEGLEADHDDSHAMAYGNDFAQVIHGVQPKGSKMGKALAKLGSKGYSRKSLHVVS